MFVEYDGLRLYGEFAGYLRADEVHTAECTSWEHVHLIKSLTYLSPSARATLLGCDSYEPSQGRKQDRITDLTIDRQLRRMAPRFHPAQRMLDSPSALENLARLAANHMLRAGAQIPWVRKTRIEKYDRCLFRVDVTPELKKMWGLAPDAPLGFANIVAISHEMRPHLIREDISTAGGTLLMTSNVIPVAGYPSTDSMVVIFQEFKRDKLLRLVGCHPGIPMPPIPDPRKKAHQSEEERRYYGEYWQKFAFVRVAKAK